MPAYRRTKIIATIGPSSKNPLEIKALINAGVNVFRFNTKHNTWAWHENLIKEVQNISGTGSSLGILLDLQGPEIRVLTENKKSILVSRGDKVFFTHDLSGVKNINISISDEYPAVVVPIDILNLISLDDTFYMDDGAVKFKVIDKSPEFLVAEAMLPGSIGDKKSLNLNGKAIQSPTLSENDIEILNSLAGHHIDYVALSFVRSAKDIKKLRKELTEREIKTKIVAKIESASGVKFVDEIIEESDVVMIARGDLGVELPIEEVAYLQKEIIKKCRNKNKQVIVATQMLQSMVENPVPTRAEATDVSNAVYDGADAVMLSAETAIGKYPVEAVETMSRILSFNEQKYEFEHEFRSGVEDFTNAIVQGAISIIKNRTINVQKILVFTETGYTANVLSSYRIDVPVIAICGNADTAGSLTLSYGIFPEFIKLPEGDFTYTKEIDSLLKKQGLLNDGETVLIVHGKIWHDPGKTNALLVQTV
jgi:pyruvate kinase